MKRYIPCVLLVCLVVMSALTTYSMIMLQKLQWQVQAMTKYLEQTEAEYSSLTDTLNFKNGITSTGAADICLKQNDFTLALRQGKIKSVLVIGDSICDGNGDSYYTSDYQKRADAGCRQILTEDATVYYEGLSNAQGWVKYFREYLVEYTSVDVFHNNAIGDKSAKWGNANMKKWIPQKYDAIFVMLGTNDRRYCADTHEFYSEYEELLAYADSQCDYLYVLTPTPAIPVWNESRTMNMDICEVVDTVVSLCNSKQYPCINLYSGMIHYAAEQGRPLDEFLVDEVHLSPYGYKALWCIIAEELGLYLPVGDMYDLSAEYVGVYALGFDR